MQACCNPRSRLMGGGVVLICHLAVTALEREFGVWSFVHQVIRACVYGKGGGGEHCQ